MDRRPKVFISAVSSELGKHRSRIALELRRRGVEVIVQEDFRQGPGTLLEKLRNTIGRCNASICLIGHVYGAEPPKNLKIVMDRHSFTQWEFIFCLERHKKNGMPLFIYLLPGGIPTLEGQIQSDEEYRLQREFIRFVEDTGLDREPIESEDKLAIRVLQHSWEGTPRIAWKHTLLLLAAFLLSGGLLIYKIVDRDFKAVDRVHESVRSRVKETVAYYLAREQVVIDTPDPSEKSVDSLPSPDAMGFTILRKDMVWDARQWRVVKESAIGKDGSALTAHSRFAVRKDAPREVFVQAPKTTGTGLFSRNFSSYPWTVFAVREPKIVGDILMIERQEHFDVSTVPVGREFIVVDATTYWNSMQSKADLWVGVIAYNGMQSASILLILPVGKPWKKYWITAAENARHVKSEPINYHESNCFLVADEQKHQWIYWEVSNPKPGYVYQLRWDW